MHKLYYSKFKCWSNLLKHPLSFRDDHHVKLYPNWKYVPIEEPYSLVAISSSIGEGGRRVVQYFHFQEAADINTQYRCRAPHRVSHLIFRRCQCGPGVPISTLSSPSHMSTLHSLCVSHLSRIMYLSSGCCYPLPLLTAIGVGIRKLIYYLRTQQIST